jgi:hypothetical protein
MTPRVFHSLVAALIRIGLLVALAIMLMAENAQAHAALTVVQPAHAVASAQHCDFSAHRKAAANICAISGHSFGLG